MNGTQSMPSFRSITIKSNDGHAGPQPLSIPSSIREPVKGISGILYKRVNFGRRWRPRWFVLRDDILSYYKIHGRHKIFVIQEIEKGTKIIGERSLKRLGRLNNGQFQLPRKSYREIHLKVSSIQESKSNKRRFTIFTGTKWLHLRAQAWEDRVAWMEALQTVKNMFPQMSNDELMAPVNTFVLSTEKLHQRLMKEGLNEAAIQDCEQIMRTEFAVLQNQLVLLKQKQSLLIDALRQLEL